MFLDGCDCGCSEDFDCASIGLYEDCDGQCLGNGFLGWLGDGYCDCGAWGVDFCCEEWNFDSGDCGGVNSQERPHINTSSTSSRQMTIDSPSPYGVYDLEGNVSEWTATIHPWEGEQGIEWEGFETGNQYILQYKRYKGSGYNTDAGNPPIYNYYHHEVCNYSTIEIDDISMWTEYQTFCEGSKKFIGFRSVRTVE